MKEVVVANGLYHGSYLSHTVMPCIKEANIMLNSSTLIFSYSVKQFTYLSKSKCT